MSFSTSNLGCFSIQAVLPAPRCIELKDTTHPHHVRAISGTRPHLCVFPGYSKIK